jgi:ATP-dependent Clp protease ATP-binding subunit ClpC
MNTLEQELHLYKPAIALDAFIGRGTRGVISLLYDILLVLLLALSGIGLLFWHTGLYLGLFFLALGLYIPALLFSFYYRMLYFRGAETVIHDGSDRDSGITFEVAQALSSGNDDLTKSFLESSYGAILSARLALSNEERARFLASARTLLSRQFLILQSHRFITLFDLGRFVIEHDDGFKEFLFAQGILPETYLGALSWVGRVYEEKKRTERWWSRENLSKVKGLGVDFSYGIAYELRKYLRTLEESGVLTNLAEDKEFERAEVEKVETAFARARGANALLVGDTDVGLMDVILRLERDIEDGNSLVSIHGKKIVVFDTEAFTATHDSREAFEAAFLRMFFEAAKAGNLIVVFQNLPQFLTDVEQLGVDAGSLMERFLSSPELHVIATAPSSQYHESIESRAKLLSLFSVIHVETPDLSSSVRVLEDVALTYERPQEPRFTYPALLAIAESADRYIVEGVMPDKAVDLLVELVPVVNERGIFLITKDVVIDYVSQKTGIPAGPVREEERNTLMNLESVLHERVIGQENAIGMIANAMRRARSGIQAKNRPMGTFLFLGPTGVGKTETAKALAFVFFGDEAKMLRLDMSEFSDGTSLARLLGEGQTPGVLSNLLREHPYGVLLLDEFEKSSPDVRNLFLQVLDEGVFTDARGQKVNARNSIIIATSNAGSQLIFDIAGQNGNLGEHKEEIVEAVIKEGVYTPELLNRFDGVILFDPLSLDNQRQIASLMLKGLTERVKAKGYNLAFDDSLLTYLVEKGYDPQFGARPMRRLIQDAIEEKIAEKIIAGGLKQGDTIGFTARDVGA